MKISFFAVLILSLWQCFAIAQSDLLHLSQDKYFPWQELWTQNASANGKHILFYRSTGTGMDTLFVKTLATGFSRGISGIRQGEFLPHREGTIIYQVKDTVKIEEVSGKSIGLYPLAKEYKLSPCGNFMLYSKKRFFESGPKDMYLINLSDFSSVTLHDVNGFSFDPTGSRLAFVASLDASSSELCIYDLKTRISQKEVLDENFNPIKINWSDDGLSLFLFQNTDQQSGKHATILYVEKILKPLVVHSFLVQQYFDQNRLKFVSPLPEYPLISADKKRILLWVLSNEPTSDTVASVEVWRSNAARLYPYPRKDAPEKTHKLACFDLTTQRFTVVTPDAVSSSVGSADGRFVVHFDRSAYLPDYRVDRDYVSVTMTDMLTGRETLIRQKHREEDALLFTPDSKSILYRDQDEWYLLDLETQYVTHLTKDIGGMLAPCRNCFSSAAISNDGSSFFIIDEYDLWSISADGKQVKKLTNGAPIKQEFAFAKSVYSPSKLNRSLLIVNPSEGILLESINRMTGETGYFKWSPKGGLEEIVYGHRKFDQLKVLPANKGYVYRQQAFDLSPTIVWKSNSKKEQIVASSNPQQKSYHWGRSEMVHYRTTPSYRPQFSRLLNGALFYPADYQPGKKYPLIINIYEDKTGVLHEYQSPGDYKGLGFNRTDFTLRGYFVLCPNLTPRAQSNPGFSMLENLTAAIKYVKGTGMIDEKAIGLWGHSFGGYETLFAATQLSDFATFVAGAAITDLVSDYFSHRKLLSGPNFRRVERDQMAMERSYYEIPEMYLANSPVHQADRIKAPILLFTGKSDTNVDWSQSVEFYLAMLRQGKSCTMLAYPDENHVLSKPENQADLNSKLIDWFGHYLKGEPKKQWMEEE